MKIKPYYKWPKLSKLKMGDKIRVREGGFLISDIYSEFNGRVVIITNSKGSEFFNIKEIDQRRYFHYTRFEID